MSSYDITPARHELPPEDLVDPNNYNIGDLKSDDDTDDEDDPRKKIPSWANGEYITWISDLQYFLQSLKYELHSDYSVVSLV